MGTCHRTAHRRFLLFAVAALLFSSSVFAAPAARVEFAFGNVSAVAADGRVRALVKGAAVEEGDTVNTNEGRVQLRFTDDGFISLHSQTIFRIEEYRWSGATDGSERGFFRLVKGGLRTIAGKLAKINKKAYQMSAAVATIGIRGTEYTMQLNGDLYGSVAEGEIEVCNAGGCLAVAAGQSYYVRDANTKPILSDKQTHLAPPQPLGDATDAVGGLVTTTGGLLDTTGGLTGGLLDTTGGLTGGLLDTTGGLTGGLINPVTGATGTLTDGITGTDTSGKTIKLGF